MLKKYLYVGVLVGAIVLAGCSISEEPEDQVQEKEDIPNGQAIEEGIYLIPIKKKLCRKFL